MNRRFHFTLRRQLDRLLDELSSAPNHRLTFEHLDLLEKRFFEVRDGMELAMEQARFRRAGALMPRICGALRQHLAEVLSSLSDEDEPEFDDQLMALLQLRFRHLEDVFQEALEADVSRLSRPVHSLLSHSSPSQGDSL